MCATAGAWIRSRGLLAQLVAQLPADQPYTFQLHVTNERGTSLAAHMGGLVYVSEGLLRDRGLTDDDLTLRLTHEVSHVTKRHVLRDFQTKLVDAWAVTQQTRGDIALTQPGAMLGLVLQRISLTQMLARTFDHGNELEADSCAVGLTAKVIGREATSSSVSRLAQSFASGAIVAEGSANHPRSDLRVQVMNLQLKGLGGQAAVPTQVAATSTPAVGGNGNETAGARAPNEAEGLSVSKMVFATEGGTPVGRSVSLDAARLVVGVVEQAKQVMQISLTQGRTQGFASPTPPLGPVTGSRQFPYGWMVHDRGGKYVALYDVSEQTVRTFNLALHGQASVMQFGGAMSAGGRPYAGYSADAKHWILLPFVYLQAN
jgi:hypothetical protein